MRCAPPGTAAGAFKMCICDQKRFRMPRKSKKKTFNFHLRKKRSSQDDEEKSQKQDSESSLSEPIASRLHTRRAKVRCLKSLSTIIRNERKFALRERARARVANESEEQRSQRLEVMRRCASKRLAAESPEQRHQRLHDLRRRAAQRVEQERRTKEQRRRTALQLTFLPSYKCMTRPAVPNVAVVPLPPPPHNPCNIVGVSNVEHQQQSALTHNTHNEDSGSHKRDSCFQDDDDDEDDYTEHEYHIDIKVEPNLDDEDLDGDGDFQTADGWQNWFQSDEVPNNENNRSSRRQGVRSKAADAETCDIEIKEEPLPENFHNIVLERTVLMMCQDT